MALVLNGFLRFFTYRRIFIPCFTFGSVSCLLAIPVVGTANRSLALEPDFAAQQNSPQALGNASVSILLMGQRKPRAFPRKKKSQRASLNPVVLLCPLSAV